FLLNSEKALVIDYEKKKIKPFYFKQLIKNHMNTFFKWKTNTIKIGAMYMYKLIAIDIDGTLINDNEEITPRVRDAIRIVREKEIKVVLVTGRPIGGVTNIIKQLGLDEED